MVGGAVGKVGVVRRESSREGHHQNKSVLQRKEQIRTHRPLLWASPHKCTLSMMCGWLDRVAWLHSAAAWLERGGGGQ